MKNYASAVRGENNHPNTLLSTHGSSSKQWTLVQPSKKNPSKKKLSVSALMNAASTNVLRTGLQAIKHTTKSHQRQVPALQYNSNKARNTRWRCEKPPLSEKEIDCYLFRASKFGVSNDTLYSIEELKAMKGRFANQKATSSSHLHHVLLGNLELDYAKRMKDACLSPNNMLRKTLQALNYFDSYTVDLERRGKNHMHSLVLNLSRKLDRHHEMKLKDIFAKHKKEGFESWLSGMTGWYYSDGVNKWGQSIVARLNDLQQVVKEYAPPDLLYCFPGKSRILLWLNRNDLWRCVIDVRFFVERAKKKLPNTDSGRRLKRCLIQNSYDGPDCLVHWAHHDPVSLLCMLYTSRASFCRYGANKFWLSLGFFAAKQLPFDCGYGGIDETTCWAAC